MFVGVDIDVLKGTHALIDGKSHIQQRNNGDRARALTQTHIRIKEGSGAHSLGHEDTCRLLGGMAGKNIIGNRRADALRHNGGNAGNKAVCQNGYTADRAADEYTRKTWLCV